MWLCYDAELAKNFFNCLQLSSRGFAGREFWGLGFGGLFRVFGLQGLRFGFESM